MGDWIQVSFRAQLPDGLTISAVDDGEVRAQLARLFGFSRVEELTFDEVQHSGWGRVLIDRRPVEGGPKPFPTS